MKLAVALLGMAAITSISIWLLTWPDPVKKFEEDDWR